MLVRLGEEVLKYGVKMCGVDILKVEWHRVVDDKLVVLERRKGRDKVKWVLE